MSNRLKLLLSVLCVLAWLSPCYARGPVDTYQQARTILYNDIYHDHPVTLYCNFSYDKKRKVDLPGDFLVPSHPDRAKRVETEHVVPVENFGRTFPEWRDGHSACVHSNGQPFRGRKCVERVNREFMAMEADLHNLYPAVGVVNAVRGNANFAMLDRNASMPFGTACPVRMEGRRVEPPEAARGPIARSYLYMEDTYSRYRMSNQQRRLMETWDKMYPPTSWECERNRRIARVQGNTNRFIDRKCQ
ncbi:MAG: endonuclease [Desulfovibrio sp.]|nr:endonuclease [Desulfovibrio sp.]